MVDGATDKKLSYDEFAEILATMRKQLDMLTKSTDFRVIMLCHEEDKASGGNMNNYPLLDGAIKFEIAGYFDIVLVSQCGLDTKTKKMKYWCKLQGNDKCVAGSRLKHLRGKATIPNHYEHLINKGE